MFGIEGTELFHQPEIVLCVYFHVEFTRFKLESEIGSVGVRSRQREKDVGIDVLMDVFVTRTTIALKKISRHVTFFMTF